MMRMTKPFGLLLSLPALGLLALGSPTMSVVTRRARPSCRPVSIVMSNPANHPRLGLPDLVVAPGDQT
jgi:hypothetical protein